MNILQSSSTAHKYHHVPINDCSFAPKIQHNFNLLQISLAMQQIILWWSLYHINLCVHVITKPCIKTENHVMSCMSPKAGAVN